MFCVACSSKSCPELPANFNYFPYYEGQELIFTNLKNNTRTLNVFYGKIDHYDSWRNGIYHKGNCCEYTMSLILQGTERMICDVSVSGSVGKVRNVRVCIMLSKELHNNDYLEIKIEANCAYKKLSKYLEDTIIIENENNKLVKKVVIVKGKGLVSYTTADGEEWNLVE